ncbi:hypothetical protein V6N13_040102 [Hibiscus sabdariffa]|uniref:Uncharacterized protein n=1 Tax=Hibiscus sabdariffa TaxID=183260 RepID=A0ABR2SUC1_9ROSI
MTVLAIDMAASSTSPRWLAKAWVITFKEYEARRLIIEGPRMIHSFFVSIHSLVLKSFFFVMLSIIFSDFVSSSLKVDCFDKGCWISSSSQWMLAIGKTGGENFEAFGFPGINTTQGNVMNGSFDRHIYGA